MIDTLFGILDEGVFAYLVVGAVLAGLVRGFSGFGTAMVFIPIAGQVLSPIATLIVLLVMELIGPLPNIPRAIRDGKLPDLLRLITGAVIGAPIGVYFLNLMSADTFSLLGAVFSLCLLFLLICGVRYKGTLNQGLIFFTGAIGGLSGVAFGIPGPPVIMLYMASSLPASVIRANNTLFLNLIYILLFLIFWLKGMLIFNFIIVGLIIAVPYLVFCVVGAKLFNPSREKLYRIVAYTIIFLSAISALPIWS